MDISGLPSKRIKIDVHSKSEDKCFHGFAQGCIPKAHMFEFKDKIDGGACGDVYRSKCVTERKCDIAIKVIPLIGWKAENAIDEKKTIKTLIANPHPNIVEYFGVLEEDDKMYIVMELGKSNLYQFLDENFSKLSVSQFHEIIFQVLEILNHLESISVTQMDFKPENMICLKNKIKLIDFDSVHKKGTRFYQPPSSRLINAALFLSKIQLKMKCGAPNDKYYELTYKFNNACLSDDFNESDAKTLSEDPDIWHDQLPLETRQLLSRSFINEESKQKQVIKMRDKISPRSELVF
ncbi:protein kinase domain-containing protein [Endozoicomonas sp. ALB032]|uniref:protein kinase domain-containing protein n=1 Tax=Endozoicomonas sp. ALB032 TaxID=3403082 RepID=UPI003BB4EC36